MWMRLKLDAVALDVCRWVRWRDHVEALLEPRKIAAMGPNVFVPFGMAKLVKAVSGCSLWCSEKKCGVS
jgi:hypothetical protein